MGTREITNRGSLRDFKSGQKDYISGQRFQIGAREITNRGRDYILVQNRWFLCELMFYSVRVFYWNFLFVCKTMENLNAVCFFYYYLF